LKAKSPIDAHIFLLETELFLLKVE